MRLLFCDHDSWEEKVKLPYHEFAELLDERGHEVFVLDFPAWERESFHDLIQRAGVRTVTKRDRELVVYSPGTIKISVLDYLVGLFTYTLLMIRIISDEDVDIILAYNPGLGVSTVIGSKTTNTPFIYHIYDYSSAFVSNAVLKIFVQLNFIALVRYAESVWGITEPFLELASQYGAQRTELMELGIYTCEFDRKYSLTDPESYRLHSDDRESIVFVGMIREKFKLNEFIKNSLVDVVTEYPDLTFYVVGGFHIDQSIIEEAIDVVNLGDNVVLTGYVERELLIYHLQEADVGVSPTPPSNFSKYNVQMKVIEYMAAGLPCVSFDLPGARSVIGEGNGVKFVETYQEMTEQLVSFLDDSTSADEAGKAARTFAKSTFDWDAIIEDREESIRGAVRDT